MEQKKCSRCKKDYPLATFHSWKTHAGVKYGKWCAGCYSENKAAREAAKRGKSSGEGDASH
jgi:hypothetical protein